MTATRISLSSVTGDIPCWGPATLRSIEEEAEWITVVHDGEQRFDGPPIDLMGVALDADTLAGEHPIERALRLLTTGVAV